MATFLPIRDTKVAIDNTPIVDGQFLMTTDQTNDILYLDVGAIRKPMNSVARLDELEERIDNFGYINVKDYGAKGDGVTDDTVAIQSTLDQSINTHNNIYIPKGTYLVSSVLRLYKNTTVNMHLGATIKRIGNTNKVFINGEQGNANYASEYNGDGNIHFNGGTIDLNSANGPSPTMGLSAFDIAHGENISFNNITIKNGQIGHYFQVTGCKNVKFRDCWFGAVSRTSTDSNNYELLQIEAISRKSFPTFGSYDYTPSKDIFIEGCTFDTFIRGIGTHSDGKYGTENIIYSENVQIKNCIFKNSYEDSIHLTAFKGFLIENNTIIDCGENALWFSSVEDGIINGNMINGAQECGYFIANSNNNKFSKNYIKEVALSIDANYSAVRILASTNNTFDDETIYSDVPNYSHAFYTSNLSLNNKIINYNYKIGKSGLISGNGSSEISNIIIGAGQTVIFDEDLSVVGSVENFLLDIRSFSLILVMGNDNSSGTAKMTSMIIPRVAILLGSLTSRYSLICDNGSASFSFPTEKSIQVDNISGVCHIRKVVGII